MVILYNYNTCTKFIGKYHTILKKHKTYNPTLTYNSSLQLCFAKFLKFDLIPILINQIYLLYLLYQYALTYNKAKHKPKYNKIEFTFFSRYD